MSYRYKLASVLLSAGLVMAACGNGGENEEESAGNSGENEETGQNTEQSSSEENSEESVDETSPDEEMDDSNDDGSSGDGNDSEDNASGDNSGEGSGGSSSDTIVQDDISHNAQEAVDTARESFDGELIQVELDHDDGQWVYKVDMEQGSEEYEVKLSVEDLSVVNESTETDDDDDSEDQFEYSEAVTAEDAVQTAIDEAGGNGEIEGWSLDKDDGSLEYEIELKNTDNGDADIKINAESGDVIETDFDNDDGDDSEDDED